MDQMSFTPSVENAGQAMPWYEVWSEVITKPSRDTFRRILADPTASPVRAFIWVALIGAISGLLQYIVYQVLGINPASQFGGGEVAVSLICLAVAAPIFSIIGLALGAGILRLVAMLLRGQGNFNDLVYTLGAVQAPFSIVGSLLSLISSVLSGGAAGPAAGAGGSILGLCFVPLSLALAVYAIVLEVLAVDTVEKFGTGKAVVTVLAPVILLILLFLCLAAFFAAALIPQFTQ